MSTAKLPVELVEEKPRTIADMLPGEKTYVNRFELMVADNADCYLRAAGKLRDVVGTVMIEARRDDAGFHVTVEPQMRFRPGEMLSMQNGLLPVASFTIGEPST